MMNKSMHLLPLFIFSSWLIGDARALQPHYEERKEGFIIELAFGWTATRGNDVHVGDQTSVSNQNLFDEDSTYQPLVTAMQNEAMPLVRLGYGGNIEVHVDQPDGPLLCTCAVPPTGGWNRWATVGADVQIPVSGVHALYLVFRGGIGRLFNLDRFWFARF